MAGFLEGLEAFGRPSGVPDLGPVRSDDGTLQPPAGMSFGAAAQPGDTVNLTGGQAPAYTGPPPLVGAPPVPQAASPQPVAPQQEFQAPAPQQAAPPPAPMAQATDTTVQVAPKLTPEQRAKEDLAFDAKIRAVDAQAELDAQKAMELAGANEVRNRQLEAQRKQDAAEAAAIQQETAEAQKRFEAAMADRKAFEQTQPKQMGIGEGILSAIAAGLGAFGSGMTGGPNQALSIINRAADKRVADWERELAGKKGNVDLSQNALAYFRSKGMDSKAAAAAARATLLDKAAEKIDYIASGYKGPEFLQRAETLKAGLVEQRIQSDNQQALNEQNKIVKRYTSAPAQGMDPRDQRAQRELEVEVPKLGADGKTEGITTFYAKSASEGKAIRDAQKVASGIRSDLQLMEALIAGSPTMNPETRQKVETLNNSIRKKYIKLDELGVPTGKDLELSSVVGDPRAWTQRTSQTRDLINRSRQDVANRLLQSYEVQGYRE